MESAQYFLTYTHHTPFVCDFHSGGLLGFSLVWGDQIHPFKTGEIRWLGVRGHQDSPFFSELDDAPDKTRIENSLSVIRKYDAMDVLDDSFHVIQQTFPGLVGKRAVFFPVDPEHLLAVRDHAGFDDRGLFLVNDHSVHFHPSGS